MEIISTSALISINATFFAQLISFLLFMLLLNRVMVRPLRKIIIKRINYINSINTRIDLTKEHLNSISSKITRKKSEAIYESSLRTNKMEEDAKKKATSIYYDTKNDIAILKQKSDTELRKQITELRANLHNEIDDITVLVMEKILDRRLTK